MHPGADLPLRGIARIVAEFLNRLDLHDFRLFGNDTGRGARPVGRQGWRRPHRGCPEVFLGPGPSGMNRPGHRRGRWV
jgi:hypothetical protein